MLMLLILTCAYAFFIILDLVPFYRKKDKKDFWIYSVSIMASYFIFILLSFEVKLPSPSKAIEKIVSLVIGG